MKKIVYASMLVVTIVVTYFWGDFASFNLFSSEHFTIPYFAMGTTSIGVFSIGTFSIGFFSIGIFSIGIFSLSLFNIALYGIGIFIIAKKGRKIDVFKKEEEAVIVE